MQLTCYATLYIRIEHFVFGILKIVLLFKVPQAIKDHYNSPPIQLLPEHIRKMQEPLPLHALPVNAPTAEEQEEVRHSW